MTTLFDLRHTLAADYLNRFVYPWQALSGLREWIAVTGRALEKTEYEEIADTVWVHKTARVAPTAYFGSCVIVGAETEVRHGAYIRGSVVAGNGCVIGNSTELKNTIAFDGAQMPHFNYVGDSVIGYKAHLGAGAITSNVKSDRSVVVVRSGQTAHSTGRKKCGAMLGDFVEIGCNSVLNPGTVIGRNTTVYPLSCVRGTLPPDSIYKANGAIVPKQ